MLNFGIFLKKLGPGRGMRARDESVASPGASKEQIGCKKGGATQPASHSPLLGHPLRP